MVIVFGVAALSLTPLALKMGFGAAFGGFCLFEWCCGVYFPTWSQLRSEVVPEQSRSAVMNIFRVPLNLIVVAMMGNIDRSYGGHAGNAKAQSTHSCRGRGA